VFIVILSLLGGMAGSSRMTHERPIEFICQKTKRYGTVLRYHGKTIREEGKCNGYIMVALLSLDVWFLNVYLDRFGFVL